MGERMAGKADMTTSMSYGSRAYLTSSKRPRRHGANSTAAAGPARGSPNPKTHPTQAPVPTGPAGGAAPLGEERGGAGREKLCFSLFMFHAGWNIRSVC